MRDRRISGGTPAGFGPDRVEKVKPDPLNLSVNTGAGKQLTKGMKSAFQKGKHFSFLQQNKHAGELE
jgi:hypothetical protein